MAKRTFQEYLCRPFCLYFKDGKKEAMACHGARVIEMLVDKKHIKIDNMPLLEKSAGLWEKYKGEFSSYVCKRCPFQAEDCDFQSASPPDGAEPCGGLILLAHLRANHLINESDLEQSGE